MNDNTIKGYATWARRELMSEVERRCALFGISGDKGCPYDAESVGGRVLSSDERRMRRELVGEARRGMPALVERAAYTWFNRMLAIRFMECNDRLPSQTRMFSAPDGSFAPQALKEALSVEIGGIDRRRVASLVQDGDDEALFRYLLLLQCDELADCMPAVFDKVGEDPLVLLLPDGLLRSDGVIGKLVSDIAEDDWRDGVQIVGWMYQFYISEKKDEFFASKRKASAEDIPAATQLFTPEWIVQYLVQNSLGRLWMLNKPDSGLAEKMDYFIPPSPEAVAPSRHTEANRSSLRRAAPANSLASLAQTARAQAGPPSLVATSESPEGATASGDSVNCIEEFQHVSSPEGITLIDPACGSGHILVYAFDLLAAIYEECGYSRRDIPRLILEKNLTGVEIDRRAGALASFALMMKALEYDSRFLRRGVQPDITVLEKVEFDKEHIDVINEVRVAAAKDGESFLLDRVDLLDALSHLDEVGSLFVPSDEDMTALRAAADALASSQGLFAANAVEHIERAIAQLEPLHARYSVVTANPPYMGGGMNPWLSQWVKENYPDEKNDLCTCFIGRGLTLTGAYGFVAMITASSWMFISSFERMRRRLIDEAFISSMIQQSTHGYPNVTVPTTMFVLQRGKHVGEGAYIRLEDFDRPQWQQPSITSSN